MRNRNNDKVRVGGGESNNEEGGIHSETAEALTSTTATRDGDGGRFTASVGAPSWY